LIKNYFITVNYNTSSLIDNWIDNIREHAINSEIVIVDNYSTEEELQNVVEICIKKSVHLIESSNVGYGRGLNKAIKYSIEKENNVAFNIYAGNLDVSFSNIPTDLPSGKYVYIPEIKEKNRLNRNPFLTELQKYILPLYYLSGFLQSSLLLSMTTGVNKLVGYFPSKIWAIHGSMFCFNSTILQEKTIFNDNSFLYCEELEFASFIESNNIKYITTNIRLEHFGQVATGNINTSKKKFLKLWWPSFENWSNRWK